MIGLGSNRLTVCRRGGMSVTQAGRGGMEWLAGGRMPSWASPYSAQATAALKDAFTAAQWATIRDYGFAHPEIVGYMNAYAPEDAKIAYSLVEGIGTRWMYNGGTAYFYLADYTVNQDSVASARYKFRRKIDNAYKNRIFGYRITDGQDGFTYFTYNNLMFVNYGPERSTGLTSPALGEDCVTELNKNKLYHNGSLVYTAPTTTFSMTGKFMMFAIGNRTTQYIGDLDAAEFNVDGHRLIPFKRNGQMELLDLVSGNLATRVGTFTELIESPS